MPSTSGIPGSDRRNWNTPVVLDPLDPDRLYYGTQRLWRSTDLGLSWTAISGDLTGGFSGDPGFNTLTCLSVSPLDNQILWAGSDDGRVARSLNGGGTWLQVGGTLPDRWITDLVADPHHAQGALVSLGGLRWNETQPHIYRTWDGGAHWTAIDAGLPQAPVYALVIDPADSLRIWAGCETGCYTTTDGGQQWAEAAPGLPLGPVLDLDFHPATRMLAAGTHGRSAFRLFVDDHSETIPRVRIRRSGPGVELSWSPVAGAQDYRVYGSTTPFGPWETGEVLATVTDTLWFHPALQQETRRFYRVASRFP